MSALCFNNLHFAYTSKASCRSAKSLVRLPGLLTRSQKVLRSIHTSSNAFLLVSCILWLSEDTKLFPPLPWQYIHVIKHVEVFMMLCLPQHILSTEIHVIEKDDFFGLPHDMRTTCRREKVPSLLMRMTIVDAS